MNANVNPGLLAYVEIREKYFGATSPVLTLEQLCTELTVLYGHLETTDLAMVTILVKADYEKAEHVRRLKNDKASLEIRNGRLLEKLIGSPDCEQRRATHADVIKMIPALAFGKPVPMTDPQTN